MSIYENHAGSYNQLTGMFNGLRRRAVELLGLRSGNAVVDVGCGTGLCFPYLETSVGPSGRVIAVDESGPMLAQAMEAAAHNGWRNITPVQQPAWDADIPGPVDAALFCAAHDILRSPSSLTNVLAQVAPGGRVVATGGMWAPHWLGVLNPLVLATHAPYVSSFEGFDRPWSLLARHCSDLRVQPVALGTGYLAYGSRNA